MSFDYAHAAATAARLISRFGQRAVLRKVGPTTGPAYDPQPSGTHIDFAVTVVDLDKRIMDRAGTMTESAQRTLIISTEGFPVLPGGFMIAPEGGDHVIIGDGEVGAVVDGEAFIGREHVLGEVRPLAPGGVVVIWEADLAS